MPELTLKDAFALQQQGKFAEAERAYGDVLHRQPGNFQALHLLGNALLQQQRFEEALARYDQALALNAGPAELFNNRGIALAALQRVDEALASYGRAIALKPDFAQAHNNRGTALAFLKRSTEALADFDKAVTLQPDYAKAFGGRGAALNDLRRPQEALESFNRAIAAEPNLASAHDGRGTALALLNRIEEALASFDRAIAIDPGAASFHNNRGSALSRLDRLEDALAAYDRALSLSPGLTQGHVNRGVVMADLNRNDAALASFDRALALAPAAVEAHFGRATSLLITGRFAEGLPEYEWRKRRAGHDAYHPQGRPQWSGKEDIAGKRLFIEAEQGLGDMIQFCRYARLAADKGAQVILTTRPGQVRLIQSLDPRLTVLPDTAMPAEFDYYCPLMSLPLAFGGDFAAQTPYLHAEADKIAQWRRHIGDPGFKIGLCWQGGPNAVSRSFPLDLLAGIANRPGVRLISLQKDAGLDQLAGLPAGMAVETLGVDYNAGSDDFIDAAAAMAVMDLVISCDTALAHLAGALARPVWVALKHAADWRYLQDRADTPWYPQMRLFRQPERGDWGGVFAAMEAALEGA